MSATVAERFWSKVDRGADDECWLWQASTQSRGYGQVRHHGQMQLAHRVAVVLSGVDLRDEDIVCHHCDTPRCVNPTHLFVGTQADNIQDAMRKGRHVAPPLSTRRGAAHPMAKLTAEQARAIKASAEPSRALAQAFDVSRTTITDIQAGRRWAHV